MTAQFFLEMSEISILTALSVSLACLAIATGLSDAVDVSLRREIRFGRCDAASGAALPPPAGPVGPMPAVGALVVLGQQHLKVPELVVLSVFVAVMDLEAVWDRTVRALPDPAMLTNNPTVIQFQLRVSVAADPARYDSML